MLKYEDIEKKLIDKVNTQEVKKAYEYAFKEHKGMKRLSGDDYISHPLEVANILTDLNVSNDTIVIAFLHEVINNGESTLKDIENLFGLDIAKAVDSISKINKLELNDDSESSAVYLRKILVGMAEDVRVLYVKLADRLHNMRTNWAVNPLKQKNKASETLNILVPIAHRLGMNSIKTELENLCLQYLKPDVYEDILDRLNASVEELNEELSEMKKNISDILNKNDIKFEIKGRVKSVYSIYKKLTTGRKWSDIFDILALRIFVEEDSLCYTVAGLIHSKFKPIPKRFKDFIASPKENMYQSLHTTVYGESGKLYEIQIRTYEMDEIAEKGIASHWSYKEKGSKKIQNLMEQKLEMFRNVIEHNKDVNDIDFEKEVETDFLKENIYVYTPKGDVVELPKEASPIDFAYRIHSKVGDTTVGAVVNDKIVPFAYELCDGDVVKINTNNTAKPNKDWLNIVKTSQARNKIKTYFSKELHNDYIVKGKNILEKEIRRKKLSYEDVVNDTNINKILRDLKLNTIEDIYLSLGSLRFTAGYIINLAKEDKSVVAELLINKGLRKNQNNHIGNSDIIVDGQSNIQVSLAKCCNPIKGDEIIGNITKYGGITIHKKVCENVSEDMNLVDVNWNYESSSEFVSRVYLYTNGDVDIVDVIALATKKDLKIVGFNSMNEILEVNVKVRNSEELINLVDNLEKMKNIRKVSLNKDFK